MEIDEEINIDLRNQNIQDTIRTKRHWEEDLSCKGRVKRWVYMLIMFIFKLQDFALIFTTVLITGCISLGSTLATQDPRLAMFYAVCGGTLTGSIFLLGRMCIRAKHGKVWVDVEVDASNLVLLLFIFVMVILSLLLLNQLDTHCIGKPSLCTVHDILSFNN